MLEFHSFTCLRDLAVKCLVSSAISPFSFLATLPSLPAKKKKKENSYLYCLKKKAIIMLNSIAIYKFLFAIKHLLITRNPNGH